MIPFITNIINWYNNFKTWLKLILIKSNFLTFGLFSYEGYVKIVVFPEE